MVPMHIWPAFCLLHEYGKKIISLKSHIEVFEHCCNEELVIRGLSHKDKLQVGDDELHRFSQERLDVADLDIQNRTLIWLKKEHKRVQKDFQMAKTELNNASGQIMAHGLLLVIKEEMDRLRMGLSEIKQTKIRNLEQQHKGRKEVDGKSNSIENQEKIKQIRCDRSKKWKRRKLHRNKERRRVLKKQQRKRRDQRETEEWIKILSKAKEVEETLEERKPLDRTGVDRTPAQLSLLSKGQKFVPSPYKIDQVSKYKDFMSFARKLRLAVYFNRLREQNGESSHSESYGDDKTPWEKQSNFDPPPSENEVLEDFLTQVFQYLFNPKNSRKFVDNLMKEERGALKEISKWNGDRANPRVIRVQDKGSCFVLDFKENYVKNHCQYISDKTTFRVDGVDLSQEISHKVVQWARKWEREGVLEESVCNWIVVENPKPAITVKFWKREVYFTARAQGNGIPLDKI